MTQNQPTNTDITLSAEEYKALTDRIENLERIYRQDTDILNMLLQMSNIYTETGKIRSKKTVFSSLRNYLDQIIDFELMAFFSVNENDSSFYLADCSQENEEKHISQLSDVLIENGEFAWALNQDRAVIVDHSDKQRLVLLHVLSTKNRVRGMFLGVVSKSNIPSTKNLNLLSVLLEHAAYSLESIELYTMIHQYNDELENNNARLEHLVEERTHRLREAVDSAEQANKAKSLFLSNMSHEFRTPLNAIMGFTQLLITDSVDPPSPAQAESLDFIFKGSQHLLTLINQVLDLAKIEAGQISLALEPVAINSLIEDCIAMVQILAVEKDVSITVSNKVFKFVHADYVRLKQVLINLLSNAIKYNKPNGTLTIDCVQDESTIKVNVIDTGIGIPLDNQQNVFTSFSRLGQENSGIEGTGVGLALSKALIEAMEGSMGFTSIAGEGSVFWFKLPKVQATESEHS